VLISNDRILTSLPQEHLREAVYLRNNVLDGLLFTTAGTSRKNDHLWGRIARQKLSAGADRVVPVGNLIRLASEAESRNVSIL
jgi:hypothetical protein